MTRTEARTILDCRGNGYSEEEFNQAIEFAFSLIPETSIIDSEELDEVAKMNLPEPDGFIETNVDCTESVYVREQMIDMFKVGVNWQAARSSTPKDMDLEKEEIKRYIEYMYNGRIEPGSEEYIMLDKCARHFYKFSKKSK